MLKIIKIWKGAIRLNSRIHKVSLKISANERIALNELVESYGKSISDLLRIAIRNTFEIDGFEPSYRATSQFQHRINSIFNFKEE